SPYVAAVAKKMPIADEINHHGSPAGPAGIHSATTVNSLAIWKFSKNVALAKDFIKFLFQKENYNAFIVEGSAFNQPPLKAFAEHPIWASNPKYAMLPKDCVEAAVDFGEEFARIGCDRHQFLDEPAHNGGHQCRAHAGSHHIADKN